MTSHPDSNPDWGNQYRLIASEKWKAKSARCIVMSGVRCCSPEEIRLSLPRTLPLGNFTQCRI